MNSPASLLLDLAQHDERICGAYNVSTNRFVYLNAAFNSFFGDFGLEVSMIQLFDLVHPDDREYLRDSYGALKSGILKNNIEFRIVLPDGNEHSFRLSLLFNDQQNGNHILSGYLEDISAHKVHSAKLNELTNRKNSILNILAHDLAGPLGSVGNLATLLARETRSLENKEIDKWISMMQRISKNGVHLIREFIQLEFRESADAPLVKKRTNLALLFKRAMDEYQQSEVEIGKVFHFDASGPEIFAFIDESKFFQAVNNLVSNALKFTPDGGIITLSLEEKEQTVLITVADNGIGIPKKYQANLFDKFNDARRTGLKGELSVGLGMSIIKTIVEWHEGKIWFDSEENKGSTFYIEIPKSS